MSQITTEPSICIPRIRTNVTWQQVHDVFEQIIGQNTVERVDIIKSKNSTSEETFCRIFIHFYYWPDNPEVLSIRERFLSGETLKIVYDNPWFWKCSVSRVSKPERN